MSSKRIRCNIKQVLIVHDSTHKAQSFWHHEIQLHRRVTVAIAVHIACLSLSFLLKKSINEVIESRRGSITNPTCRNDHALAKRSWLSGDVAVQHSEKENQRMRIQIEFLEVLDHFILDEVLHRFEILLEVGNSCFDEVVLFLVESAQLQTTQSIQAQASKPDLGHSLSLFGLGFLLGGCLALEQQIVLLLVDGIQQGLVVGLLRGFVVLHVSELDFLHEHTSHRSALNVVVERRPEVSATRRC